MLDGAFVECDCPVRRIVAYRRGNLEGSGQLGVDTNFLRSIQIFGKLTLNALVGRAIGKHIVLNCLLGKKRLIKALGGLFCRKDRAVVFSLNGIVGDMLHNHSGLLLIDQPDHFRNKLFRVVLEHIELVGTDTLQDCRCRFACELCAVGNFANQIILDLACFRVFEGLCPGLFVRKRIAAVNFVLIHVRLLASNGSRVLQFRNKQLFINVSNGLANQLGAVELHRVGILVVNFTPQSLKLFLGKILIQRIFFHFRFMTIGEHILKNAVIINRLNKRMNPFGHRFQLIGKLRNLIHCDIPAILVRDPALHIHIAVLNQIELDSISLLVVDQRRHIVYLDILSLEVLTRSNRGAIVKHRFNIRLQICNEGLVALAGNNGQGVDFMHTVPAALHIHTVAVLVDAKAQTTTNFLPLCGITVRMFQRADLEHIRVIPALTQRRVGENEPRRLLKRQQPFFIF